MTSVYLRHHCNKYQDFFKMAIIPELVRNYFTRPLIQSVLKNVFGEHNYLSCNPDNGSNHNSEEIPASCRSEDIQRNGSCCCWGPETVATIKCSSTNCRVKLFHLKCLTRNTADLLKKYCYCPECCKSTNKRKFGNN